MKEPKENHTKNHKGVFLVVLAGICWGMMSIFVRGLTSCGLTSMEIMSLRAWLSVVLMLVWFLLRKPSLLKVRPHDLWMFVGSGILSLTFFSYCYFRSILISGASVAVVLLYTSPAFVMLMSSFVFQEKFTRRKLLALLLTIGGCVLVAGLIGSGASLSPFALLLGLGAGFGYALYSIFAGLAVKKYSSLTITFYTFLFSGLTMPFLIDFSNLQTILSAELLHLLPYLIGITLVGTVIPYLAYTAGLSQMEAGNAAVLVTVEPMVGTLLGIFVWQEATSPSKLAGIAMIFLAVLMLSV